MKTYILQLALLTALTTVIFCCNNGSHYITSNRYSEKDLKTELLDTNEHDALSEIYAIRDTATAISIAESILFSTYGRENIIDERPYEVQKIQDYYIINGTLPEGYDGGVFLIVIDSRTSRVVRLTHWK